MQQFLVIATLGLLITLALNYNRATFDHSSFSYKNEAVITATGIGQSIIEEVRTKAFDEKTVSAPVTLANNLTFPSSFGPESDEPADTSYDDVSDYHDYSRIVSTSRLGNFSVRVSSYYINPSTMILSSYQTFSKEVDVKVFNNYLQDTVKLSTIISH